MPIRRGIRTDFATRLQDVCGPVYAFKSAGGCRRSLRNATYTDRLNTYGTPGELPLYAVNGHEAGQPGFKVTNRHGPRSVVYFDLDTHARGDTADVRLMAAAVRQHFPQMSEFVVNERGGSGWLLVDTSAVGTREFAKLLDTLQTYLNSLAKAWGLDIEFVEVLGRPYLENREGRKVLSVKAGDLYKCPPSADYIDHEPVDPERFRTDEFALWVDPCSTGSTGAPDVAEEAEVKAGRKAGSFKAHLITDRMEGRFGRLATWVRNRFWDRPKKVDNWAISERAFLEVLLSMSVLKPNADGSNPGARFREFVKVLNEAGVYAVGWNAHRYKAVRDYLSRKGFIEWTRDTYKPGRDGVKGEACRWRLDAGLVAEVLRVVGAEEDRQEQGGEEHEVTLIDSEEAGQHRHFTPRPVWTPPKAWTWPKGTYPGPYRRREEPVLAA